MIIACIPAYNEEATIAEIIEKTSKHVDKVIVGNDGSQDATEEILKQKGVETVSFSVNLGKGAILRETLRKAREFDPEYVVVLDGDGQHDPEDIPVLFAKLKESEADMVVGSRYVIGGKANPPLYRHYGLVLFNFLNNQDWTMSVQDVQSGYRVFNRKTLELFIDTSEDGFGVEMEQILIANNNGLKIVEAPISIQYSGLANTSKKNPFFHGLDLISTILRIMILEKPLMISGIPGVVSLIIGLLGQWRFMKIYNTTGSFNVTVGVVSIFFLLNGIVLLITSLLMYGMILMRRDSWLGRSP